ncbi:hypothetical protein D3C85_1665290 [compost metagenome]
MLLALQLTHPMLIGGDGEAMAIHHQLIELGPQTGQVLSRLAKRVARILGACGQSLQSVHDARLARRELPQDLPGAGV